MTYFQRKEANRYYWMIKGQLIPESWKDEDVISIYDSYFKRIWGNHEAPTHEIGFEAAWSLRQAEQLNRKRGAV